MARGACAAALMLGGATSTLLGSTVLVDFSDALGSGGPGGTWNTVATPAAITAGVGLLDVGGVATGISVSRTAGNLIESSNTGPLVFVHDSGVYAGLPAWAASTSNNLAAGDIFYTDNGTVQGTATLTFTGLTVGNVLSMDILSSRNAASASGGFFEYSLDGGTTWAGFSVLDANGVLETDNGWGLGVTTVQGGKSFNSFTDGFSEHRYLNVAGVVLTGTTLQLRLWDANLTSGHFTALNALRLEVGAVPEPGIGFLLLGALGGMLLKRRRC
ncbi:PEP-CTERM sorting domain-containing protein [Phragmitibacter flavus]|nr:PEP-CTERM sorting domain-containing protein [Phragmitibacter flavus]